jgi:HEAT repeat protein
MSANDENGQMPDATTIDSLVTALVSDKDATRWEARKSLVAVGQAAVPHLIKALKDPNVRARWEATQALAEIADPSAAPALVDALGDNESGVRWTAVDALITLKERALIPLLERLMQQSESVVLRDSAHHLLKNTPWSEGLRQVIAPVLTALEGAAPVLEIPFAARSALAALVKGKEE